LAASISEKALAMGWVLYFSSPAARLSSSVSDRSAKGTTRSSVKRPWVKVPVLSNTTRLICGRVSSTWLLLINNPRSRMAAVAAVREVGGASAGAQAQVMSSTDSAIKKACSAPAGNQKKNTASDTSHTASTI